MKDYCLKSFLLLIAVYFWLFFTVIGNSMVMRKIKDIHAGHEITSGGSKMAIDDFRFLHHIEIGLLFSFLYQLL